MIEYRGHAVLPDAPCLTIQDVEGAVLLIEREALPGRTGPPPEPADPFFPPNCQRI
ncbi:hypothetical protein BEL01nite_81520 [Bradyrhizobium elkanii]|nr:hypothetical protein BEL01nite_81520 [Bradyrhizobium elkanii]